MSKSLVLTVDNFHLLKSPFLDISLWMLSIIDPDSDQTMQPLLDLPSLRLEELVTLALELMEAVAIHLPPLKTLAQFRLNDV